MRPIVEIAEQLGLDGDDIESYGRHKAKVLRPPRDDRDDRDGDGGGKLILVTSMTPTRQGSGKTVTSIGLGQAFGKLGLSHCVCLREPSLGPTLGMKGGGTGGGAAQVVPMADINLHFTGDMHAIGAAHNLLSAMVDNHAHFDSELSIDRDAISWPRVVDLCDRQLREVQLGLGADKDGFPHRAHYDITAASEVMAVLALSEDRGDLEARLGRMQVARNRDGGPVTAADVGAVGAMTVLLKDALRPNLVQTIEGTPALLHCGPFANIAHGCSSVIATRTALGLTDYVITEAGFGADLGAEKFVHIKCRGAGLSPACAVVVVTMKSLRRHGGAVKGKLDEADVSSTRAGLANLRVHLDNLEGLGLPCVVALNRFPGDDPRELSELRNFCADRGVEFGVSDAFADGGAGALDLAHKVRAAADGEASPPRYLYAPEANIVEKVEAVASAIYRAGGVDFSPEAASAIERIEAAGHGALPVCMAKTPYSLTDRAGLLGAPHGHRLQVRDVRVRAGAGMVLVLTGSTVTMPGMPRRSAAERIHLDDDGEVAGLT